MGCGSSTGVHDIRSPLVVEAEVRKDRPTIRMPQESVKVEAVLRTRQHLAANSKSPRNAVAPTAVNSNPCSSASSSTAAGGGLALGGIVLSDAQLAKMTFLPEFDKKKTKQKKGRSGSGAGTVDPQRRSTPSSSSGSLNFSAGAAPVLPSVLKLPVGGSIDVNHLVRNSPRISTADPSRSTTSGVATVVPQLTTRNAPPVQQPVPDALAALSGASAVRSAADELMDIDQLVAAVVARGVCQDGPGMMFRWHRKRRETERGAGQGVKNMDAFLHGAQGAPPLLDAPLRASTVVGGAVDHTYQRSTDAAASSLNDSASCGVRSVHSLRSDDVVLSSESPPLCGEEADSASGRISSAVDLVDGVDAAARVRVPSDPGPLDTSADSFGTILRQVKPARPPRFRLPQLVPKEV